MTDVQVDDILESLRKMSITARQFVKDIDDVTSKVQVMKQQRTLDEYDRD